MSELIKRYLGKTCMKVSAIAFGGLTVRKKQLSQEQTAKALRCAIDMGVNYIDTAEAYGESEKHIGNILKDLGYPKVFLASKTGDRTAAGAIEAVHNSLRLLKTDCIDLYQIHYIRRKQDLNDILERDGALEGLEFCRKYGMIKHIGITGHRNDLLVKALETGRFETVMPIFNITQRDAITSGLIKIAREKEVGIIAMKGLCDGFLRPIHAIRFLLDHTDGLYHVDTIAVGMETEDEVEEDLALGRDEVDDKEHAKLEGIIRNLEDSGCVRCNYCMDLGYKDVPTILPLYDYRSKYGFEPEAEKEWCEVIKRAETLHYGEAEQVCPRKRELLLPIGEQIKKAIDLYRNPSQRSPGITQL